MPDRPNRVRNTVLLLILIGFLLAVVLLLLPSRSEDGSSLLDDTFIDTAEDKPGPSASVPEREQEPRTPDQQKLRLAVVIDDVGYNMPHLEPFLRFPAAMTIAVLPHLPYSDESAREADRSGKEVILHCPMEPLGSENPGPGAIMADQDDAQIRRLLDEAFQSVPAALGMNNHMGSRIMQNDRIMRIVMNQLRERAGFFLDSKTISSSVAVDIADEYGVPHLSRSVFLDNDGTEAAIKEQFLKGMEIAEEQGFAVLIGHVQNLSILNVWAELLPEMESRGVEAALLSELMGS